MGPGGVFVVEGAGADAAVEDADEAVGEGSECLVVEVAVGSVLVVERSTAGTGGERAERHLVERVVEAPVANVAGEHGAFGSGCNGEW